MDLKIFGSSKLYFNYLRDYLINKKYDDNDDDSDFIYDLKDKLESFIKQEVYVIYHDETKHLRLVLPCVIDKNVIDDLCKRFINKYDLSSYCYGDNSDILLKKGRVFINNDDNIDDDNMSMIDKLIKCYGIVMLVIKDHDIDSIGINKITISINKNYLYNYKKEDLKSNITEEFNVNIDLDDDDIDSICCFDCLSSKNTRSKSSLPSCIFVKHTCEIINDEIFSSQLHCIDLCCGVLRLFLNHPMDMESSCFSLICGFNNLQDHHDINNTSDLYVKLNNSSSSSSSSSSKSIVKRKIEFCTSNCFISSWSSWIKPITWWYCEFKDRLSVSIISINWINNMKTLLIEYVIYRDDLIENKSEINQVYSSDFSRYNKIVVGNYDDDDDDDDAYSLFYLDYGFISSSSSSDDNFIYPVRKYLEEYLISTDLLLSSKTNNKCIIHDDFNINSTSNIGRLSYRGVFYPGVITNNQQIFGSLVDGNINCNCQNKILVNSKCNDLLNITASSSSSSYTPQTLQIDDSSGSVSSYFINNSMSVYLSSKTRKDREIISLDIDNHVDDEDCIDFFMITLKPHLYCFKEMKSKYFVKPSPSIKLTTEKQDDNDVNIASSSSSSSSEQNIIEQVNELDTFKESIKTSAHQKLTYGSMLFDIDILDLRFFNNFLKDEYKDNQTINHTNLFYPLIKIKCDNASSSSSSSSSSSGSNNKSIQLRKDKSFCPHTIILKPGPVYEIGFNILSNISITDDYFQIDDDDNDDVDDDFYLSIFTIFKEKGNNRLNNFVEIGRSKSLFKNSNKDKIMIDLFSSDQLINRDIFLGLIKGNFEEISVLLKIIIDPYSSKERFNFNNKHNIDRHECYIYSDKITIYSSPLSSSSTLFNNSNKLCDRDQMIIYKIVSSSSSMNVITITDMNLFVSKIKESLSLLHLSSDIFMINLDIFNQFISTFKWMKDENKSINRINRFVFILDTIKNGGSDGDNILKNDELLKLYNSGIRDTSVDSDNILMKKFKYIFDPFYRFFTVTITNDQRETIFKDIMMNHNINVNDKKSISKYLFLEFNKIFPLIGLKYSTVRSVDDCVTKRDIFGLERELFSSTINMNNKKEQLFKKRIYPSNTIDNDHYIDQDHLKRFWNDLLLSSGDRYLNIGNTFSLGSISSTRLKFAMVYTNDLHHKVLNIDNFSGYNQSIPHIFSVRDDVYNGGFFGKCNISSDDKDNVCEFNVTSERDISLSWSEELFFSSSSSSSVVDKRKLNFIDEKNYIDLVKFLFKKGDDIDDDNDNFKTINNNIIIKTYTSPNKINQDVVCVIK